MSKTKHPFFLFIAFSTVLAGGFLFLVYNQDSVSPVSNTTPNQTATTASSTEEDSAPSEATTTTITTSAPDWKLVYSKKYGYSYYLPEDMYPDYFYLETFTGDAENKSLDVFVQEIFNFNQSDDNPHIKDESITVPKKVAVNGITAYEMIMSGAFEAPDRSFVIDQPSRFLFFEAPLGAKLMVYYPVRTQANGLYEQILKTFRIDKTLIPPKVNPDAWQQIARNSFSISYPSNLFKPTEETNADAVSFESVERGLYGHVGAWVEDRPFDPHNIEGMYGKIDDAKKFAIQGRDWYQYGQGDAGCGSYIYETALTKEETLRVSFSTCPEEDAYPIMDDITLQQKILETVVFN